MTLIYLKYSLMITGSFLLFVSCLGVFRLPDIYCRSHALAKSLPLSINLLLVALWIHLGQADINIGFKTFLAVLFQVISIPVSSHLIALIAFKKNVPRWKERSID